MNNSVQKPELSGTFLADSTNKAYKGQGEDGGTSFSSILSGGRDDQDGINDARSLPLSGKKLPEERAHAGHRQENADGTTASENPAVLSGEPEVSANPSAIAAVEVQSPSGEEQILVQDTLMKNMPESEAPATGEVLDVAVQTVNTDDPDSIAAMAQPGQGYIPEMPATAMLIAGNLPVADEQVTQAMVPDIDGARSISAASQKAVEKGHISDDTGSLAGTVKDAVQFAMTSQAPDSSLKQFMQGNRNNQSAVNPLASAGGVETNAVSFLQTLSDGASALSPARVQVPVGQPGWGDAVGQQVTWFVSQNISAASLRLNPRHLGPMEMAVSMHGDQASISFTSQHAIVRDALDASIPRLREMLSENGLNLVNVNVSQQGSSYGDSQNAPGYRQDTAAVNDEGLVKDPGVGSVVRATTIHGQGLVDFYA